jgi:nucleoid DNA-binding protein
MTRSELVVDIGKRTKLPRRIVAAVLEVLPVSIIEAIRAGESVTLPGFGAFYHVDLKPKELFGEGKKSALRRKIRFRQSRSLR